MNKFMIGPDSLAGLAGCAFWLTFLAAATALLFGALAAMVR